MVADMVGTTIKKLKESMCYCTSKEKDINLKECRLFDCHRWKKCMQKTNKDIDKDLKKTRK